LEMRYLNGPTGDLVDSVIARESAGGTIAWYLPDRLGTIRDLINNSGGIIDHVDYSAFGTVLDESSPTSGDRLMGFAEMERDSVTGLNLAVERVEDPGTGRWDSEDPLGFGGEDCNLYRYVRNDPANGIDPSGNLVIPPTLIIPFLFPPYFPTMAPYDPLMDGTERGSYNPGKVCISADFPRDKILIAPEKGGGLYRVPPGEVVVGADAVYIKPNARWAPITGVIKVPSGHVIRVTYWPWDDSVGYEVVSCQLGGDLFGGPVRTVDPEDPTSPQFGWPLNPFKPR
jgi:RHS repeat-associated protein